MSTTPETKTPAAWQWKPDSSTNRLVDEHGKNVIAVTMPSTGIPRISVKPDKAALIAQAPGLLAHAEKSLRWLIGERDCVYEAASTDEGDVPHEDDVEVLATYDRDIAELTALIAAARGQS